MTVKTFTITENAYDKIKRLKHGDESFSELFTRLAEHQMNLAETFFGSAKLSSEELEDWRKKVKATKCKLSESITKKQALVQKKMKELKL